MNNKIGNLIAEIRLFSQIVKSEPQAAYSCFVSGYKHKVTFYMSTTIASKVRPLFNIFRVIQKVIQHFSLTNRLYAIEGYKRSKIVCLDKSLTLNTFYHVKKGDSLTLGITK